MTIVSMASVLTGTLAPEHQVRPRTRLTARIPTLAERLRDAGYATSLVTANPFLGHTFGLARGFDRVEELFATTPNARRSVDGVVPAELVSDASVDVLAARNRPFFLLAHYLQPHGPYAAPERKWGRCGLPGAPFDGREAVLTSAVDAGKGADLRQAAIDCYDDNVAYADEQVCRLVEQIDLLGERDSTVIVVTSDHGEQFTEHGHFGHPRQHLYDEQLHVPLVLHVPARAASRVDDLVELSRLGPTLLDVARVPGGLGRGTSLLTPAASDADGIHAFAPVSRNGREGWRSALRTERHKLLQDADGNTLEVYDLTHDPGETVDLSEQPLEETDVLRERLDALWSELGSRRKTGESTPIDAPLRAQLRALGYID